jgi:hypothetical protein
MRFDRVFVDNSANKALDRFVAGASLNDIVKEIAAEYDLNNEQLKRICEAANVRVKRYLSDKTDNQFFTFELADWGKIIDELQPVEEDNIMDKEASLLRNDWETFDEELFPNMEKTASARTLNVDAIANLYTQVESAEVKVRKLYNDTRDKLASTAESLISKIGMAFRNDEGDLAYSTALSVLSKKSLVDELFKTAADRFLFETYITPKYENVKIAGVVNPKSCFALELNSYMKLRYDLVKAANAMDRLQKARTRVLKTIRETVDKDCSEPV